MNQTLKHYLKKVPGLFFLRVLYRDLFQYREKTISLEADASQDYDEYWKNKRGEKIGVLSPWQKDRADIVVSILKRRGISPIVIGDIGCGEGSILKYIQDHFSVSEAIGYDHSAFVLEKAKAIGITTVVWDMVKEGPAAKLKDADYMIILEVLEHLANAEQILNAAYAHSRQGVFFSFPNTGYVKYRTRLLLGRMPMQWVTFPNEHLRFWTARDLKWWLKAQGFTNAEIHFYRGVPLLNKLWPALFAAAFVVFIPQTTQV